MKKILIPAACYLFPNRMRDFVYHQMTHPKASHLRHFEASILEQAEKEVIHIDGFQIQIYKWSGGAKEILLVHGWEGHAANFAFMVDALRNEGFTVYAFDGPGHGQSSRDAVTFFDFSRVVGEVLIRYGAPYVLCHSFGSVATIYALYQNQSLCIKKMILLTTPNQLMEAVEDARDKFSLTDRVCRKVVERIKKETGHDLRKLAVQDFVQSISVEKALIIHDKADRVLPIERSRTVCQHWRGCDLIEIEGAGHFRILRSPEALAILTRFLTDKNKTNPAKDNGFE